MGDRTLFDAIKYQFGINEQEVISMMRNNLKPSSFKLWRKRVQGKRPSTASKEARMSII